MKNLSSFLLFALVGWLSPAVLAQSSPSSGTSFGRAYPPSQLEVPASQAKSARYQSPSPHQKEAQLTGCQACSGQMSNRQDVLALKAEIEARAQDPDFDWQSALKRIYSSSHVLKVPIMDPTFPIVLSTGDKARDQQAYQQAKAAWVRQYPERYEALKRQRKENR